MMHDVSFCLTSQAAMIGAQRQQRILDALGRQAFLGSAALARTLAVSRVTVYRDLEELAALGLVRRVRGGIARIDAAAAPTRAGFHERQHVLAAEKDRIGRAAARLAHDGDTIIMDGGTTTNSMTPYLVGKQIKVVTNSLTVADYLNDHSQSEVIVTGGYLYRASKVLLGPPALQTLRQVNATTSFVSAGGVTLEGIGHSDSLVVETEKLMIARGRDVVLLIDHSKFLGGATMKVCPWTRIGTVITDQPVPPKFAAFFARHHIRVILAR